MKTRILLVFLIASEMFISCSSSDENSQNLYIIGKWTKFRTDYFDDTESSLCGGDCQRYEFKSNGTYIFYEGGDEFVGLYKIDGDFIKFYSTKTELLVDTDRIISLTNDQMSLSIDEDTEYITDRPKRIWVFKKIK